MDEAQDRRNTETTAAAAGERTGRGTDTNETHEEA
jgi:hypothetical protein